MGIGLSSIKLISQSEWDGASRSWEIAGDGSSAIVTTGFFPVESWGAWADSLDASVALPVLLSGRLQLSIRAFGVGSNIGREVAVRVGDVSQTIILGESLTTHVLNFDVKDPASRIFFEGYCLDTEVDSRGLGIGLTNIEIIRDGVITSKFLKRTRRLRDKAIDNHVLQNEKNRSMSTERAVKNALGLTGKIYLLRIRTLDLLFENWIEVIKTYSLALENESNVNLLVACPTRSMKHFLPLAMQFLSRINHYSTPIHFVFIEDESELLNALAKNADLVVVRGPDELELNINFAECGRRSVDIGPSTVDTHFGRPTYPVKVRRQIRQMIFGEHLPLVLTHEYDNEELFRAFVESSKMQVSNNEEKELTNISSSSFTDDFIALFQSGSAAENG